MKKEFSWNYSECYGGKRFNLNTLFLYFAKFWVILSDIFKCCQSNDISSHWKIYNILPQHLETNQDYARGSFIESYNASRICEVTEDSIYVTFYKYEWDWFIGLGHLLVICSMPRCLVIDKSSTWFSVIILWSNRYNVKQSALFKDIEDNSTRLQTHNPFKPLNLLTNLASKLIERPS